MSATVERKLYTKRDAATAISVSEKTIDRLIAKGELESIKFVNKRMVLADSLDAFVERQRTNGAA
jgi:excisionase family DNA binding protein